MVKGMIAEMTLSYGPHCRFGAGRSGLDPLGPGQQEYSVTLAEVINFDPLLVPDNLCWSLQFDPAGLYNYQRLSSIPVLSTWRLPLFLLLRVNLFNCTVDLPLTLPDTCFHSSFLLGLFFDPEDGSDMLLRNVSWLSTDCTELYHRRKGS
jgi:hypothetical protein